MTQIKLCRLHVNATHDVRFQSSKDSAHFLLLQCEQLTKPKNISKIVVIKLGGPQLKINFSKSSDWSHFSGVVLMGHIYHPVENQHLIFFPR